MADVDHKPGIQAELLRVADRLHHIECCAHVVSMLFEHREDDGCVAITLYNDVVVRLRAEIVELTRLAQSK